MLGYEELIEDSSNVGKLFGSYSVFEKISKTWFSWVINLNLNLKLDFARMYPKLNQTPICRHVCSFTYNSQSCICLRHFQQCILPYRSSHGSLVNRYNQRSFHRETQRSHTSSHQLNDKKFATYPKYRA